MMALLPTLTFRGVADYFAYAAGLVAGFVILSPIMKNVQDGLSKSN